MSVHGWLQSIGSDRQTFRGGHRSASIKLELRNPNSPLALRNSGLEFQNRTVILVGQYADPTSGRSAQISLLRPNRALNSTLRATCFLKIIYAASSKQSAVPCSLCWARRLHKITCCGIGSGEVRVGERLARPFPLEKRTSNLQLQARNNQSGVSRLSGGNSRPWRGHSAAV